MEVNMSTRRDMVNKLQAALRESGYSSRKYHREIGLWNNDIDSTERPGIDLTDVISWCDGLKLIRPGITVDIHIYKRFYPFTSDDVELWDNIEVKL